MADQVEIINDLTPEQLRDRLEPKPVIVGNEEEIEEIKRVYDTEIIPPEGDEAQPETAAQDTATPQKPKPKGAPAPTADTLEIDGQQVPLEDVKNRYKFWTAANQRAAQVAADRRRLEEERLRFEADRKAADDRINQILDERLPPPPVKAPEPIQVDLTLIGPPPERPNMSTLEGQEGYETYAERRDEWEQKRLALIIAAAQEQARTNGRQEHPADTATPTRESPPAQPSAFDHNAVIGGQFKAPDVLAEFGIDDAKAQAYLERMDREFAPASPDGRWSLNEVRILARRFQEMEQDVATRAAQAAEDAAAARKGGAIKKAANASDVVRGGGAPAQRSLKVGDVLAMPVEDLRRRIAGPMKGRGGPQAHGLDPLYRTWEESEKIS